MRRVEESEEKERRGKAQVKDVIFLFYFSQVVLKRYLSILLKKLSKLHFYNPSNL